MHIYGLRVNNESNEDIVEKTNANKCIDYIDLNYIHLKAA